MSVEGFGFVTVADLDIALPLRYDSLACGLMTGIFDVLGLGATLLKISSGYCKLFYEIQTCLHSQRRRVISTAVVHFNDTEQWHNHY